MENHCIFARVNYWKEKKKHSMDIFSSWAFTRSQTRLELGFFLRNFRNREIFQLLSFEFIQRSVHVWQVRLCWFTISTKRKRGHCVLKYISPGAIRRHTRSDVIYREMHSSVYGDEASIRSKPPTPRTYKYVCVSCTQNANYLEKSSSVKAWYMRKI